MISYLEPDILECEVKWALESIATNKPSGGDAIPVELFQILKDDAGKVPGRREWQPTPVFLLGEAHGQRSLEGCSPPVTESDTTE